MLNNLLLNIDSLTRKSRPITKALDLVVEKIVPKTIAKADFCPGLAYCYSTCRVVFPDCLGTSFVATTRYFAYDDYYCSLHSIACTAEFCGECGT